jgi:DDE superfamily endonuclease
MTGRITSSPGWEAGELGLAAARLVVLLLVPPGAPLGVAADDSLFRRSGRRVHGAGWQHDGSAPGRGRLGFGTCFVVAGIVAGLPFCTRPVCLPVLARLVLPGKKPRPAGRGHKAAPAPGTKVSVAVALVTQLAAAFPGRAVHVVADAAYHGPAPRQLPASVTWTTRPPANAVLYALAPPRLPGERGRPCLKGLRPGTPAELAVPFALIVSTLVVTWYARHGHPGQAVTARRQAQPWYATKTEPAFEDMLTQLRRTMIAARISAGSSAPPTPDQTQQVLAAWTAAAAQLRNTRAEDIGVMRVMPISA